MEDEVVVTLTAPGGFSATQTVEGGEAIFADQVISVVDEEVAAGGWKFTATAEGGTAGGWKLPPLVSEPVNFSGSVTAAGGGGTQAAAGRADDEEITDSGILASMIKTSATGGKMRHFLMLTKGRMWGRPENAASLAEVNVAEIINQALTRCDQDEAIECVALIQELLSNPTGAIVYSCGACRASIRPDAATNVMPKAFQTPGGLVFHENCLLCQQCQKPTGDAPFVRNHKLQPFHTDTGCVEASKCTTWTDSAPLTCVPLVPPTASSDNYCAAVQQFLSAKTIFVTTLKANHYTKDDYVYDRAMRMLARIPQDIANELADLKKK